MITTFNVSERYWSDSFFASLLPDRSTFMRLRGAAYHKTEPGVSAQPEQPRKVFALHEAFQKGLPVSLTISQRRGYRAVTFEF